MARVGQVIVVGVLLAALGVQSCRVRQAEQRAAEYALRADSVEAAADSTRVISTQALAVLGDSLRGVERRVVQEQQRADGLDRALGRERIARAGLGVVVDSLRSVVLAIQDTISEAGRHIVFHIDTVPFSGTAEVTVPPVATPTLDLRLAVAPIPLQLRLGCGDAVNGIRPATATAIGPTWATLTLDSLSQSPDLCRSPALTRMPPRWPWMALGATITLLAGFLLP